MNINVTFGQATVLDPQLMVDAAFDGILGLAFQSLSVGNTLPPFLAAYRQNIIDEAVFTVLLRRAVSTSTVFTVHRYGRIILDRHDQYAKFRADFYYEILIVVSDIEVILLYASINIAAFLAVSSSI